MKSKVLAADLPLESAGQFSVGTLYRFKRKRNDMQEEGIVLFTKCIDSNRIALVEVQGKDIGLTWAVADIEDLLVVMDDYDFVRFDGSIVISN